MQLKNKGRYFYRPDSASAIRHGSPAHRIGYDYGTWNRQRQVETD